MHGVSREWGKKERKGEALPRWAIHEEKEREEGGERRKCCRSLEFLEHEHWVWVNNRSVGDGDKGLERKKLPSLMWTSPMAGVKSSLDVACGLAIGKPVEVKAQY